ncbi:hypothetical protein [Candidatus Thiosymbion oneisti]|uniref:hypothetical protein n=1 Tax=Candidatus Thiosymbion oneisti TaxID=589554 RepID=UPI000AAA2006|nr:hypothetical protein [Candidatus Thiosymbion oneisti]
MSEIQKSDANQKRGFLEDDCGKQSSMRLMSIIALVASIAFGSITMLSDEDSDKNDLYIVTVFLIAAFAPKAVQKFAEAKLPPKD